MPVSLEAPTLFIDAASADVVLGVLITCNSAGAWRRTRDEAGTGIFRLLEDDLEVVGTRVADLRCVVFCEGPGSILGIRIAAMALRTWNALRSGATLPCFAYRSLDLVAVDLLEQGVHPPFGVISDARRNSWNLLEVDSSGRRGAIRRVAIEDGLPRDHPLFYPSAFPHWQALPDGIRRIEYRPETLPALAARHDLLHAVAQPDAFMIELPEYRKWAPTATAP